MNADERKGWEAAIAIVAGVPVATLCTKECKEYILMCLRGRLALLASGQLSDMAEALRGGNK